MFLEVFWTVLPKTYLETQLKVCGGALFAKINNNFLELTIFAKKLRHRCLSEF